MREIKFRGKRLNRREWEAEWIYGAYLEYPYGRFPGVPSIVEFRDDVWLPCAVDRKTVGQAIGLKDKNGVDIYTGDVIIYDFVNGGKDPVVGIVTYKTGCASNGVVPLAYPDSIELFGDLALNAPLEVVGNIFDDK